MLTLLCLASPIAFAVVDKYAHLILFPVEKISCVANRSFFHYNNGGGNLWRTDETMDEQAQALLDRLVPELADCKKQAALAYWKATTTGDKQYEQQYSDWKKGIKKN